MSNGQDARIRTRTEPASTIAPGPWEVQHLTRALDTLTAEGFTVHRRVFGEKIREERHDVLPEFHWDTMDQAGMAIEHLKHCVCIYIYIYT